MRHAITVFILVIYMLVLVVEYAILRKNISFPQPQLLARDIRIKLPHLLGPWILHMHDTPTA
jgi:hypothetical protein